MANPLFAHPGLVIAVQLVVWSVAWLVAAVIGLWRSGREQWRSFWLVSGLWCAVDAAIGLAGLMGAPAELPDLRRVLLVNGGLDVVYVAFGVVLATRPKLSLRGSGWAVIIQGVFLLAFDLGHGLALASAPILFSP